MPLKCLAKAGAKLDAIDRPWSVVTGDAMTISVSRVALGALNEAEVTLGCGA